KTLGRQPNLEVFGQLTGLIDAPKDRPLAYADIVKFILAGTVMEFQFQVENLFKNLYRELEGAEVRNYQKLGERLMNAITVDVNRLAPLRALANLRNCMHNNGVHAWDDSRYELRTCIRHGERAITISGECVFERGSPVTT